MLVAIGSGAGACDSAAPASDSTETSTTTTTVPAEQQESTSNPPGGVTDTTSTGDPAPDEPGTVTTTTTSPPSSPAQTPTTAPSADNADGVDDGASTPTPSTSPADTNSQTATVVNRGTAVANSGSNTALATTGSAIASSAGAPSPDAPVGGSTSIVSRMTSDVDVQTGPADAVGSADSSVVHQSAIANSFDHGAVDILQVALVINIGISHATTGHNVAVGGIAGVTPTGDAEGAASPAAIVDGTIETGDVTAAGNQASSMITQSAVVGNSDHSTQLATVVNLGSAVGNSGLNVAVGNMYVDGTGIAHTVLSPDVATALGSTGAAAAVGNRSDTHVQQRATAVARDTAVLTIDQRTIVVNFGNAFANTGGNLSVGILGDADLTVDQAQAVASLIGLLAPFYGTQPIAPPASTAAGTNVSGTVATGSATAQGNDASTWVAQTAIGVVHGDGQASVHQLAGVANLGIALANSGFNVAIGQGGSQQVAAGLMPVGQDLAQFASMLSDPAWMDAPDPFASLARTIEIGGFTLNLNGTVTGQQYLSGWDPVFASDPHAPAPLSGVRVRQISGVLDIGIAFSDTGHNVVVSVVRADSTQLGASAVHLGTETSDEPASVVHLGTETSDEPASAARSSISTGDAFALGSHTVVIVCQTLNDDVACAPKVDPAPEPTPEPSPPAETPQPAQPATAPVRVSPAVTTTTSTPPTAVAARSVAAAPTASATSDATATLPFTGTDARATVWTAIAMIVVGGGLARRRRPRVDSRRPIVTPRGLRPRGVALDAQAWAAARIRPVQATTSHSCSIDSNWSVPRARMPATLFCADSSSG